MSGEEPPFTADDIHPDSVVGEMLAHRRRQGMEPPSDEAVTRLAWMMWCWQEGYRTIEDRAILTNWFGEHQDNAEDEATRQHLLTMAREVLSA